jgi:hypothetical protein
LTFKKTVEERVNQTDRETDRQTGKQTDRGRGRHICNHTKTNKGMCTVNDR